MIISVIDNRDDWREAMFALEKRILVLEQSFINMRATATARSTSIPTWVAIAVTGLLGALGLAYQIFVGRPGP